MRQNGAPMLRGSFFDGHSTMRGKGLSLSGVSKLCQGMVAAIIELDNGALDTKHARANRYAICEDWLRQFRPRYVRGFWDQWRCRRWRCALSDETSAARSFPALTDLNSPPDPVAAYTIRGFPATPSMAATRRPTAPGPILLYSRVFKACMSSVWENAIPARRSERTADLNPLKQGFRLRSWRGQHWPRLAVFRVSLALLIDIRSKGWSEGEQVLALSILHFDS
jgi:hypothetical protein